MPNPYTTSLLTLQQGDADAIAPRASARRTQGLTTTLGGAGPSLRQEEKGEGAVATTSTTTIAATEAAEREQDERRLRLSRVAGRVLGLALRNGMPLGVVLPPGVWRALLDVDDPLVPKETLPLPSSSSPASPVVAAPAEEGSGGQGGMEAGATTNPTNHQRQRRRGGARNAKGASPAGGQQQQQRGQQEGKQSAATTKSVSIPMGRWRELVGEDRVLLRSLEAILAHDFSSSAPGSDALEGTAFVVTEEEEGADGKGGMREVELVPGGAALLVNNANKRFFVELVARRRVLQGAEAELGAMKEVRACTASLAVVDSLCMCVLAVVLHVSRDLSTTTTGPPRRRPPALSRALLPARAQRGGGRAPVHRLGRAPQGGAVRAGPGAA